MKSYKIRKFQNGRNRSGEPFINYSLTIPTEIAQQLPPDMTYTCTLDEDGIHFQPVVEEQKKVEMPSWAKSNGNGPKDKRSRPRPGAKKKDPEAQPEHPPK